jgi:tetratricopeptide (TPR) repeat protein
MSENDWAVLARTLAPTPNAYSAAIAALVKKGDVDIAAHGIAAATSLFPADPGICAQAAQAAERRGDWPAAIAAWQRVRAAAPGDVTAAASLGRAYMRAKQPGEAERVLDEAIGAAPQADPALLVEYARAAAARGDFGAARTRWQAVLDHSPDHRVARRHLRHLNTLKLPEIRDDAPWMKTPAEGRDTTHAPLMLRFESLGYSCEFGLTQRHFGAEPLGLLRWVGINMHNVISAMNSQFDGIGEPRYTRLDVTEVGEFVTSDTRYGLGSHTFMRNTGQDQEKLIGQLRRRMRFLREKLLEDLREGEKIFVYRHAKSPPDSELLKLLDALRAYNASNRLVVMRMLPHGSPGEGLRFFAPGAVCGAIADGRRPGKGQGWDIDHAFWLDTCRHALELLAK